MNKTLLAVTGAAGLLAAGGILVGALVIREKNKSELNQSNNQQSGQNLNQSEKDRINAWLAANNLNQYGDPQGALYAGGTPLFDERTGQTTDRYDYIIKNHPYRPWNK